jgi:hypothetical protein
LVQRRNWEAPGDALGAIDVVGSALLSGDLLGVEAASGGGRDADAESSA